MDTEHTEKQSFGQEKSAKDLSVHETVVRFGEFASAERKMTVEESFKRSVARFDEALRNLSA